MLEAGVLIIGVVYVLATLVADVWGADISANYVNLVSGYWWQTLFPALALASLVVAVTLIADSVEQVLAS